MQVESRPGADKTNAANVYAQTRSRGFGSEVQKRILLGTYALTAE
jgi:aspartyl-tRNA(Asn)/glutamyl-tRNA(Gln) amidotransferase subunit A